MTEIVIAQAVPLVDIPDVELVAAGTWNASTGKTTFTREDLENAVAAIDCPGVRNPVLKLGHDEEDSTGGIRWDGEPAVGYLANMRLTDDGNKIVGDYRGVPSWLAEVMATAYPDRSVEIWRPFVCQIGHRHPSVITAMALLGVTPPGVGVLKSLQDVRSIFTTAGVPLRVVRASVATEDGTDTLTVRLPAETPGRTVRLAYDPAQDRDARGRWTNGFPGHTKFKGLDDDAFEQRSALVKEAIGRARKTHATEKTHTNEVGAWTPERDKLHREIVDKIWKDNDHVPSNGESVIAGGLGGAGKTTVLTQHAGIDTDKYLTINPDDIKEEMAGRGMIPAVPDAPDLSPMERAALVHEESSRIAHMLAARAYAAKKNVIWDITMSSEGSVRSRVDALKEAGYEKIEGVFVDIPVETSVERAMARYRRGVDDYLKGKGHGGRYVPPEIIRAQQTSGGKTVNREVFEGISERFSGAAIYDNSVTGQPPRKVA